MHFVSCQLHNSAVGGGTVSEKTLRSCHLFHSCSLSRTLFTRRFEAAYSRLGQRTRRSRGWWQRRPAHAARVRDRGGADASASRRSSAAHRHVDAVMSGCWGRLMCAHDIFFYFSNFLLHAVFLSWCGANRKSVFIHYRHDRTKEYIFHTCTCKSRSNANTDVESRGPARRIIAARPILSHFHPALKVQNHTQSWSVKPCVTKQNRIDAIIKTDEHNNGNDETLLTELSSTMAASFCSLSSMPPK